MEGGGCAGTATGSEIKEDEKGTDLINPRWWKISSYMYKCLVCVCLHAFMF